ncbi:MAG: DUF1957 domain-containing protein [Armatimonadetes bacterium]|nr:DUF1957 domain-containing protein [Armatimonadota bacterium]
MSSQPLGYFAFVLHSHIPYVLSHGRWPHGSDWLLEVTAETYIPLLDALYSLIEEGCSPKITIGITPVLAEQLADDSFKYEMAAYLRMKAKTALDNKKDFSRLHEEQFISLADFWHDFYSRALDHFKNKYRRSLLKAFAELQDAGHIEIMTSSATHGYSPLLSQDVSIQAQVKQGVATYKRHFNRQPLGFWLPECAYRPGYRWSPPVQPKHHTIEPYQRKGIEEFLAENGLKYFIIESHLLHGGETRGVYIDRFGALQKLWAQFVQERPDISVAKTPYQPYLVKSSENAEKASGVFVFVRDEATGSQVWSRWQGFPGDEWYLEFHKKYQTGGLRYWRVTGPDADLGAKQIYEVDRAFNRTYDHAKHFLWLTKEIFRRENASGRIPIICAPYDTELFGHWWFEGINWLKEVIKGMHYDPEIQLVTCSEYLEKNPPTAAISLPEGSWGEGGFHYMWLNQNTEWTWSHIYDAELEMRELVEKYADNEELLPILKQAARELFLLQSSDWQFNISTGASKDYGEARLTEHCKNFKRLAELLRKKAAGEKINEADWVNYKLCEERDCLFPDIDPSWWKELDK